MKGDTTGALELLSVAGIVALHTIVESFLLSASNSKQADCKEPILRRETDQLLCSDISINFLILF